MMGCISYIEGWSLLLLYLLPLHHVYILKPMSSGIDLIHLHIINYKSGLSPLCTIIGENLMIKAVFCS